MAELSNSLLKKIKESEERALESCHQIQQYEQDIINLERRCQEELNEELELKTEVKSAKQDVLEKKIEKSQMMHQYKSAVNMCEKKKDLLRTRRKQRTEVLKEITHYVDTTVKYSNTVHLQFGFAAEKEERQCRIDKIQHKMSHLDLYVKTHFSELSERQSNSSDRIEVAKKLEFERKSLKLAKNMLVNLEAESNDLMIQLEQNDSSSTIAIKQLEEDIRDLSKKVDKVQQDGQADQDHVLEDDYREAGDVKPCIQSHEIDQSVAGQNSPVNHQNSLVTKLTLPPPISPKPGVASLHLKMQPSPCPSSPRPGVSSPQPPRSGTPKRSSVEIVSNGSKPRVPSLHLKTPPSPCPSSPRPGASSPQPPRPGTPRKRPSVEIVSNGSRFVFKKPFPPPPRK